MASERRIGLDFDNTIISYDAVFLSQARELGFMGADFSGCKTQVRDAVRLLPNGERCWQQLQGLVYGKGIADARLVDGVDLFLRRCRRENISIYIVSHKTEFGHYDPKLINLRDAARDWMKAQGFFNDDNYGISAGNVFFESTRHDKLGRIARLGCSLFIDDLHEVLSDPAFPPGVERVLFAQRKAVPESVPYAVCPTWHHIEEYVFRARE
jgi:hypothetical protein